jgi:hypothetical protein
MKKYLNGKNALIVFCIPVVLLGGWVCGFRQGSNFGRINNTEVRNEILDLKPYDASLQLKNLEYHDISPSGFTVEFDTSKTIGNEIASDDINGLVIEWGVYPSDILIIDDVQLRVIGSPSMRAIVDKYSEGGTVFFRIVDQKTNNGSLWYYINLPEPDDIVITPPELPEGK